MASNQQDIDIDEAFVRETADFILSKLDIYPSGACGPRRDAPIDCFKPIHQPYHHESHHDHAALASLMASTVPGSIPRAIGDAVVYDRDIEQSFASALALESVYLAIENFLDFEPGICGCDATTLLERFCEFLGRIGTQTLTITHTSLVTDMVQEYNGRVAMGLQRFSCHDDIVDFATEFVRTRECFFYAGDRMPAVEATFSMPTDAREGDMRVYVHYKQSQPRMLFKDLRNVVGEGERWTLHPLVEMAKASSLPTTAECFLSPVEDEWLRYDDDAQCFQGNLPIRRALMSGAGRLDSYTIPLTLNTVVTRYFPNGIRLEHIIRVAIPLTVRRRPDQCTSPSYGVLAASPHGLPMRTKRSVPAGLGDDHSVHLHQASSPLQRQPKRWTSQASWRSKSALELRTLGSYKAQSAAGTNHGHDHTRFPLAAMQNGENTAWKPKYQSLMAQECNTGDEVRKWRQEVGGYDEELPSFQSDL